MTCKVKTNARLPFKKRNLFDAETKSRTLRVESFKINLNLS